MYRIFGFIQRFIDDIPQQIDNALLNDTFRLLITISWQSAAVCTGDDNALGMLINCLKNI